jgi:hypothetical protein
MDYNPENEFYCQQFIKQLEQISTAALSDINVRFFDGDERELLDQQSQYLRPAFDKLTKLIFDPLRTNDPAAMHRGYEQLRRLMVATYLIGNFGRKGRKFFEHQGMALAREKRAQKPKSSDPIGDAVLAAMGATTTSSLESAKKIQGKVTKILGRDISPHTIHKRLKEIRQAKKKGTL